MPALAWSRLPGARWLAATLALAMSGAGCASSTPATTAAGTPTAVTPVACASSPAPATTTASPRTASPDDWTTYHHTSDRAGVDTSSPPLGTPSVAWADRFDGPMLAQPLIVDGRVVVATENDTVAEVDADSGCLRWSTKVGVPVPSASLQCPSTYLGDTVGITATPVVDVATGVVYAVAYETPDRDVLVGLDLDSGRERVRVAIDPPGSHPQVQLSRGALAISQGRVLAVLGGRAGDCGDYHGYVVSAALDGSDVRSWRVPATDDGGIWAPSGVTVLEGGDLLVATGNGNTSADPGGGDSVVRLTPRLTVTDSFTPRDWQPMAVRDFDLGSTGPAAVGGGRFVQVGKAGEAFLLDSAHLGNLGGEVAELTLQRCYAIGGTAADGGVAYLPCDHGISAVRATATGLTELWRGPDTRAGSPIVAGGAVWSMDFEGGMLDALDPSTGRLVAQLHLGVASHFVTPASSRGHLYIGAGANLVAVAGV